MNNQNKLKEYDDQKLFENYLNGDDQAKLELLQRYVGIAINIAKKYNFSNIEFEEIVSIGKIGLLKGFNCYDPTKNTKLFTHIYNHIKWEISKYLRTTKKLNIEISLQQSFNEYSSARLLDTFITNENYVLTL